MELKAQPPAIAQDKLPRTALRRPVQLVAGDGNANLSQKEELIAAAKEFGADETGKTFLAPLKHCQEQGSQGLMHNRFRKQVHDRHAGDDQANTNNGRRVQFLALKQPS